MNIRLWQIVSETDLELGDTASRAVAGGESGIEGDALSCGVGDGA